MKSLKKTINLAAALALGLAVAGCSGELTDNAAPVELVVTNTQNLNVIELNPIIAADDPDCDQNVGTVQVTVVAKREGVALPASQVRLTRYKVSYQRIDGGRLVPASYVRSIDALIAVGGSTDLSDLLVVDPDALAQAPFAALLPQNGGRDPDTGRPFVKMDVIIELFGETLGGDNVYDATRFSIDFCYGCGGCS